MSDAQWPNLLRPFPPHINPECTQTLRYNLPTSDLFFLVPSYSFCARTRNHSMGCASCGTIFDRAFHYAFKSSTLELAVAFHQRIWDLASSESHTGQRLRLIYRLLDLDEMPNELNMKLHEISPSRRPTSENLSKFSSLVDPQISVG